MNLCVQVTGLTIKDRHCVIFSFFSSLHFSLHPRHLSYVQTVSFYTLITEKDKVQGVSFIAGLSKAVLSDTKPSSAQTTRGKRRGEDSDKRKASY